MKYKFIDENKDKYPIEKMANALGISRGGYYKDKKKPVSDREINNIKLKEEIKYIFIRNRKAYGSPKIYDELQDNSIKCGKNKVARLMREMGLKSSRYKKFKVVTTNSDHNYPISENVLNRDFTVSKANKVWVSDLTYISTDEGWLYLCIILDLFSRNIVGWSMADNMKTEMVIDALNMAYLRRNPHDGLVFHSDQGVQYASCNFRDCLRDKKMISSMSRKGNCWDNAPAESFFSTLKMELIYQSKYSTREMAKRSIFEYIEVFYNRERRHSKLGSMSPFQFELKNVA